LVAYYNTFAERNFSSSISEVFVSFSVGMLIMEEEAQ
jgi:hypothetical protein